MTDGSCFRLLLVFIMVQPHSLVFPAILAFNILCSATNVLPRAAHAAPELPAFVELHDVIIGKRDSLDFRNALQPRTIFPASPPQERIFANSSSVITKRTLLGLRQSTCDAGYNLCDGELPLANPIISCRLLMIAISKSPNDAAPTAAATANAATTAPA